MDALSELYRFVVHGQDGDVGRIEDVYFDDQYWVVRHLVVDSRHWLRDRKVLIPPAAVGTVDHAGRRVEVALTRARVKQSPRIDTAKPVSRQHHVEVYDYYGFPYDWTGPAISRDPLAGFGGGDPHLRSAQAMTGYHVRAVDGEIGQVEDFLVETESWAIRYVVVRSGHRLDGHHVLVSPEWVTRVSWEGRRLETDLSHEALRDAPGYDRSRRPDRAYEGRLHEHHRRPPYWRPDR
jgi:sporulation protein YlmC with PRC-barrel domain